MIQLQTVASILQYESVFSYVHLGEHSPLKCQTTSELNPTALKRSNNKFKEFTEILIKIANESIPKTSGKLNPKHKPWFNEDCKLAIANRKQAVRDFSCSPSDSGLAAIKITRAKARRTIRQSKRQLEIVHLQAEV
jgi:hypothetical protein